MHAEWMKSYYQLFYSDACSHA